jgi:hypothetical protein
MEEFKEALEQLLKVFPVIADDDDDTVKASKKIVSALASIVIHASFHTRRPLCKLFPDPLTLTDIHYYIQPEEQ